MKNTYIPDIDSAAKKIIAVTAMALFVVLILVLVYALLFEPSVSVNFSSANNIIRQSTRYIATALLVIFLLAVCVRLLLSPWVKSDDEKEFERKADYVLGHRKRQTDAMATSSYSPLKNLTPEEEQIICSLLKDLPEHISKPGHINLAQTMHYLTALQQAGYIDDKDLYNLRLWLIQVTGKEVPATSQFNEAYPSKAATKVAKARQRIETALVKIR